MSKMDKLEKLAQLKEKGILTKKEFEIEKKAILVKYEDDEEEDCGVDGNCHQNSAWGYFLDSLKKGPFMPNGYFTNPQKYLASNFLLKNNDFYKKQKNTII
jgi:hypothetical protein